MAGYIILAKYTQKGLDSIKTFEERVAKSKAALKEMGIKFVGLWLTMGEYDWVGIADAPDDQTMAAWALILGKSGNYTTMTMRAFSEKEIPDILKKLP
jgi:uncharacterized protein with GYD domain